MSALRSAISSCLRPALRTATGNDNLFNPLSLSPILWYTLSTGYTYTDTGGTTPAAIGSAVAYVADRSGNGRHGTQSTSTARPKLWNRYNRVQHSEDLAQTSYWTSGGTGTINSNATTAPDGNLTADEVVENSAGALLRSNVAIASTVGEAITVTVRFKRSNCDWVRIIVGDSSALTNATRAWFNLATGAAGGTSNQGSGWSTLSYSLVEDEEGFYTAELKFISPTAGFFLALVTADANLSTSRANVGAGAGIGTKFFAWGIDVRNSACDHLPYQWVGNSPWALGTRTADYDTDATKFPYYAAFDLADDTIAATIPAITGQIVFAGTWGIWIDTFTHAGGAFEIGTKSGLVSTYTGGADGLLNIIGNPIGCIIREGSFTAAELENIKRYYYSLGAPGYFSAGTNQFSNGGFDTDTVWSKGTGWTIAGGKGVATTVSTTVGITQTIAASAVGEIHLISQTVSGYSAGGVRIERGGVNGSTRSANGSYNALIVATAASTTAGVYAVGTTTAQIDDVSDKVITLVPKP